MPEKPLSPSVNFFPEDAPPGETRNEQMSRLKNQEVALRMWSDIETVAAVPEVKKAGQAMIDADVAYRDYHGMLVDKYIRKSAPAPMDGLRWLPSEKDKSIVISSQESSEIGRLYREYMGTANVLDTTILKTLEATGAMSRVESGVNEANIPLANAEYRASASETLEFVVKYVKSRATVDMAPPPVDLDPTKPPATMPIRDQERPAAWKQRQVSR